MSALSENPARVGTDNQLIEPTQDGEAVTPSAPREAPQVLGLDVTSTASTSTAGEQPSTSDVRAAPIRDPEVLRKLRDVAIPKTARVRTRQEWIGRVETVGDETFQATLRDAMGRGEPVEEEAELWLEQVSPADLSRVRPGAIFYWTIGYRDEPHGQRLSVSSLHFRRRLPLSDEERSAASEAAADMSAWLRAEDS